jgi:hypothetical protein
MDRTADARTHLRHALELYRCLEDRAGEARTRLNLAFVLERQGRYREALEHCGQAWQSLADCPIQPAW